MPDVTKQRLEKTRRTEMKILTTPEIDSEQRRAGAGEADER